MSFRTQISDAVGARPDLIGERADGSVVIAVEAKFWAGLTDNQPVQYLKSLPSGGVLLFVVPEQRTELIWEELKRHLTDCGSETGENGSTNAGLRTVMCGDKTLALATWRAVLNCITIASEAAGETNVSADVRQLAGLCERMDSEAFLPLTNDELCPTIGRRIVQFGQIADDLTNLLAQRGLASLKGFRASAGNGWYGRYLRIHGCGVLLHYSFWKWPKLGRSPLSLDINPRVFGATAEFATNVRTALMKAGIEHFDWDGGYSTPIYLVTSVERDVLINNALAQSMKIVAALQPLQLNVAQSGAPTTGNAAHETQVLIAPPDVSALLDSSASMSASTEV